MKETRNDSILTTLKEIDVTKLKEEELNKTANKIANTININGLRRHINSTLMLVVESKTKDDEQKLELIKTLLNGQKVIEKNVRNFKRKTAIAPTDKKDISNFIITTAETLIILNQYHPTKEEKKAEINTPKAQPQKTTTNTEAKAEATAKAVATKKK